LQLKELRRLFITCTIFNINGEIPDLPIYIDSPLAVNVTSVFQKNINVLDDNFQKVMKEHEDPFGFRKLRYVRSTDESKALNHDNRSSVIISASGMCEGGRVLHHLENNVSDMRSTILIVGYMAENTLGRRIMDKESDLKIFGEIHKLRAEVVVAGSFSADADRDELLEYIKESRKGGRLKSIYLVHGEEAASLELALSIKDLDFRNVFVPKPGESVDL
jgi:metallo-beta-lactamase family protein